MSEHAPPGAVDDGPGEVARLFGKEEGDAGAASSGSQSRRRRVPSAIAERFAPNKENDSSLEETAPRPGTKPLVRPHRKTFGMTP